MKADDKVPYEELDGTGKKEKYTHFEELKAKVEVLQEHIELISKIMKQNDMVAITERYELLPDFDDEMAKKLEED